jgi:hypothetical protein
VRVSAADDLMRYHWSMACQYDIVLVKNVYVCTMYEMYYGENTTGAWRTSRMFSVCVLVNMQRCVRKVDT